MQLKILNVICFLNYICCVESLSVNNLKIKQEYKESMGASNLRAPFFELPCMLKRGTCAREFACPPGTKVTQRDLCPQQQRLGMECCRPYTKDKLCLARNGYCLPNKFTCPTPAIVTDDVMDCLPEEICCITRV